MPNTELKLAYQREIFTDFLPDSGLLVMARGLGIMQIVKAYVELHARPEALVFLLGATSEEETDLMEMFTAGEGQLVNHVPFRIIKNDTPSTQRYHLQAFIGN